MGAESIVLPPMPDQERLRIFIGSSTESMDVVEALQSLLEDVGDVTCWPDAFGVARFFLDDLRDAARSHDYAVFVFGPDDETMSRGRLLNATRDNVLVEVGLFNSTLGPQCVVVLTPADGSVRLPTDLTGITHATYCPPPPPGDHAQWRAALRPAAGRIRDAIRREQRARAEQEREQQERAGVEGRRYLGVSRVHPTFPDGAFSERLRVAKRVRLLNLWLPNLAVQTPALEEALGRGCDVHVFMLHPYSPATRTRASTLGYLPDREPLLTVLPEIKGSFRQLERLAERLDHTPLLKVYVFPDIPAMPIYQADDYLLLGLFLHGRLAVTSPQLEITEPGSVMAAVASDELEAVAASSQGPVDLRAWQDWLNENL